MTRSTFFLLLGGLAVGLLAQPAPAEACKCMLPAVPEAREAAVAVFEGRVSAIEDVPATGDLPSGQKRVTLALVRTWKGLEDRESVAVTTSGSSASCGYMFEPNTSYLVYGSGSEAALEVSGCSRTQPLSGASEDLSVLGAGITPVEVKADATPAKAPNAAPKTAGCGSVKAAAQANASLVLLPVTGLVLGARRRRR